MWIGFYKLPLLDISKDQSAEGCAIGFGGGTARVDSLFMHLKDPYANMRDPAECASDPASGFEVMNALLVGGYSNRFSVAPRQ
jgi:hypothetical protein